MIRLHRRAAVLLFLTACAGGGDADDPTVTPPTTPPPVAPATPASLSVRGGDGQSGEPSVALSVPLAVVVRDAAGRALAGVPVSFVVDSGGGSLTNTSSTTATDGTASAGTWTLGPATGRQVVSARVGALPPARFVATAEWANVELPEQTVAASGGVVRVVRPGRALDGVELTVPPAAVDGSVAVRVAVTASAPTGLPAGSIVLGPAWRISASPVTLREPLLLRVPFDPSVGLSSGDASRVVWMRERDGVWRALPRVRTASNHVDVLLPSLGAAPSAPSVSTNASAQAQSAGATVIDLVQGLLRVTRDVDAGYRPGTDDWDFARQPVFGPSGSFVDPGPGMISSSLWYFSERKAATGALHGRFQERRGIPESNRRGFRWTTLAGLRMHFWNPSAQVVGMMQTDATQSPSFGRPLDRLDDIKRAIFGGDQSGSTPAQPDRPAVVHLFAGSSADAPKLGLAYRVSGKTIELAIPDAPGQTFSAEYDANGMRPFTVTTVGGGTFTVQAIAAAAAVPITQFAPFLAEWPRVVDGTIGDAEGWRAPVLRTTSPRTDVTTLDPADVRIVNSERVWWTCPQCPATGFSSPTIDDVNVLVHRRLARSTSSTLQSGLFADDARTFSHLSRGESEDIGYALYQPGVGSLPSVPNGLAWLDWTSVRYRRMPFSLTPRTFESDGEDSLEFSVSFPVASDPAGASSFTWSLRTPEGVVTETTAPSARSYRRLLRTDGAAELVFDVYDRAGRLIGIDTARGTVNVLKPRWRLTSVTKLREVGNVNGNPRAFWEPTAPGPWPQLEVDYINNTNFQRDLLEDVTRGVLYFHTVVTPTDTVRHFGMRLQFSAMSLEQVLNQLPRLRLASDARSPAGWYALAETGNNRSGSIQGTFFVSNTVRADKSSDKRTLTGTFRIGEAMHLAGVPPHYVEYAFTATRIP